MTTKPNGKEQVDAMARLAKPLNTEQNAPADQAWQPDELAGFRVGDLVDLPTIGRCEVIDLIPPSLLKLRTSTGTKLKAGWMACNRTRIKRPRNVSSPGADE